MCFLNPLISDGFNGTTLSPLFMHASQEKDMRIRSYIFFITETQINNRLKNFIHIFEFSKIFMFVCGDIFLENSS